jgi:uncharacterized RmlC-like cupin family protein
MPKDEPLRDWKQHGVRVVHADELDTNTPQTAGMNRAAAITYARAGAVYLSLTCPYVILDSCSPTSLNR